MKNIHFHAVNEDFLQILRLIESVTPLQYVKMGNFLSSEVIGGINVFNSSEDIPNLGKANADSTTGCDSFLVCDQSKLITQRPIQTIDRICIDQLLNPDTVVLTPGGLWTEDILLQGYIGTCSDSNASQRLMKRFSSEIRKEFIKVKAFYVGPKAFDYLNSGTRLTMSASSPREFNLISPASIKK